MIRRHMELFGPDLARGPFSSHRIETAALQIATALAQVRAPLTRTEDDVRQHADFIRQLADRLAPDYATDLQIDVGDESGNSVQTTLRTALNAYSLFDIWLADAVGGGVTTVPPAAVTFNIGTVLATTIANRRFAVITSEAGIIDVTVSYGTEKSWYWGVARTGRVQYSDRLRFT